MKYKVKYTFRIQLSTLLPLNTDGTIKTLFTILKNQ